MKKWQYQIINRLAISIFVGLSVYGLIAYMGGEINVKLPFWTSISLGLFCIICIVIFVITGDTLDRIEAEEELEEE